MEGDGEGSPMCAFRLAERVWHRRPQRLGRCFDPREICLRSSGAGAAGDSASCCRLPSAPSWLLAECVSRGPAGGM